MTALELATALLQLKNPNAKVVTSLGEVLDAELKLMVMNRVDHSWREADQPGGRTETVVCLSIGGIWEGKQ